MHTVKGYWGLMGWRFMLGSLLFPAVVVTANLLGFMVRSSFSARGFTGTFFVSAYLVAGIGGFALGLILLLVRIHNDKKLQCLKKIGKAYKPLEVTVQPSMLHAIPFSKNPYRSFSVACTLRNSKGDDIIMKSRQLAVFDGLFIIPQPSNINCRAMVYVNPNNKRDFAIDVWIH